MHRFVVAMQSLDKT